tara:strand:+ start:4051 stop:5268 length:1218 start_codon:yes stop_codon:yes gene_type:complete
MPELPRKSRWMCYLALLVTPGALLVASFVFNLLTLEAVGEYAGIDRIVREQRATGGLYNGFVHSVGAYKKAGYGQSAPDVTVIGSSRSLQVRDYFFKAGFYNAGGEVRSPTEAFAVTDALLRLHKPKHLVWFMDFFHFCASSARFRKNLRRPVTVPWAAGAAVQRGLVPFQLIAAKKVIGLSDFLNWGTGGAERSRQGVRLFGLGVQRSLDVAFGPDGSLYKHLDGPRPRAPRRLDVGIAEIEKGTSVWKHDCHLNLEAMQFVDLYAREMAAAGINLTLIAAPLPEFMLKRLRGSGRYGYLDEWRKRMTARHPRFLDYTSVAAISGRDCEFLDYYHGGEVTYMRIMADIGRRADTPLHSVIDTGRLDALIARWAGSLTVADNRIGDRLLADRPRMAECGYAPPGA